MLLFYMLINFNLFSSCGYDHYSAILYQGIKLDERVGLECTSSVASEHHLRHKKRVNPNINFCYQGRKNKSYFEAQPYWKCWLCQSN